MVLRKLSCSIFSLILLLLVHALAYADIKLPAIINHNMVLQQGMKLPVWGKADPYEKVIVNFDDQLKSTVADKNGSWLIYLDSLTAQDNRGPFSMIIKGKNTIELHNILIGEVWLCSGQSNMVWPLAAVDKHSFEADISQPEIRLFNVTSINAAYDDPTKKDSVFGNWQSCNKTTSANFSAVAYFFAYQLKKQLNVPIGLISNPVGGTPAEAWLSEKAMEEDIQLKDILKKCSDYMREGYQKAKNNYHQAFKQWEQETEKARAQGKTASYAPYVPFGPNNACWPANLFHSRVAPLIPFGIRGVIWYQGESNVNNDYAPAKLYDRLFPALIKDWRNKWQQGDFPFYYVQIAPFRYTGTSEQACAIIREAQIKTLALKNTALAGTMDIGDITDIHPPNKWDVGKRLARCALAKVYGKNIVYSGPMYDFMTIGKGKIRLHFSHADSGLVLKGDKLLYIQIAGADKMFVDAHAVIEGNTIVVSSERVPAPKAVRYGFRDDAVLNLFNKSLLPALPFRTYDW